MTKNRKQKSFALRVPRNLLAKAAMTLALVLAPAISVSGAEKPTETGDVIGAVAMQGDGTLLMSLRSVECNGAIAEGQARILQNQKNYQSTLDRVGGLKIGETKPLRAEPLPPCPTR